MLKLLKGYLQAIMITNEWIYRGSLFVYNRHNHNLTFGLYSTAKKCHSWRSHPAKHGETFDGPPTL